MTLYIHKFVGVMQTFLFLALLIETPKNYELNAESYWQPQKQCSKESVQVPIILANSGLGTLHKKRSFPLRFSSVNVTKSVSFFFYKDELLQKMKLK